MISRVEVIDTLNKLAQWCEVPNEQLHAAISKTHLYNNWLTPENYTEAIQNWIPLLSTANLEKFCAPYSFTLKPKRVGIIMAGNIPLVGFHDLLCVLLSGNIAVVKPSSDDKYVIPLFIHQLIVFNPSLAERLQIIDRLDHIDAVIATGSNNSFRYFEHYFKHIPSILRKNRKSFAIVTGKETEAELQLLGQDVFGYFGLGCRNVSLIFLPIGYDITKLLDQFMSFSFLSNHNKFANNYTYHRAMLLMNNEPHLDTGFALFKENRDLNAPLSVIYYSFYADISEIDNFLNSEKENIQCVVGKKSDESLIALGNSQRPDLQDFADDIDTLLFLNSLSSPNELIL